MKKYALGIDFGTLSGRSVLVDVGSGEEVAYSVSNYAHGVISERMPDGTTLPPDWALQHPQDYIDVLQYTIPDVMQKAGISNEQIVGVGIFLNYTLFQEYSFLRFPGTLYLHYCFGIVVSLARHSP